MTHILRIDASSRPAAYSDNRKGSHSRALANRIVANLKAKNDNAQVGHRDLSSDPIPHIRDATIAGFYTPPEELNDELRSALGLSDTLIAEVRSADAIVISCPIYNFTLPSSLKAWIDHIVRIGHTFAYEDGSFRGLVDDRPTYLALAYGAGGYRDGGTLESYDHLKPYLTMILNFIGIQSITAFAIEATTSDDATLSGEYEKAFLAVDTAITEGG